MPRLVWAFDNHSPTCNGEQGENADNKRILAQSGECEAENKVAQKESAFKPIRFVRLCFSYIDNLNHITVWTGHILSRYPGSAVAAPLFVTGFIYHRPLLWFTLCKQPACFVFQTEISQLRQEMVDLRHTLLREKVSERKKCFEISLHL